MTREELEIAHDKFIKLREIERELKNFNNNVVDGGSITIKNTHPLYEQAVKICQDHLKKQIDEILNEGETVEEKLTALRANAILP